MPEGKRLTSHNGRGHKDGSKYSIKHNDRQYKPKTEEQADRRAGNLYLSIGYDEDGEIDYEKGSKWRWYSEADKNKYPSFAEVEREHYKRYRRQYDQLMENYKRTGHEKKITFEAWCDQYRQRPEEQYFQIGNVDDGYADPEDLKRLFVEFMMKCKRCMPYKILDVALHVDESGPHIHWRRVYEYTAKLPDPESGEMKSYTMVGQNKALEQAGFELPHPAKRRDRHNNRKQTMTRRERELLEETARELRLDKKYSLIFEPAPDGNEIHKEKEQYIRDKLVAKEQEAADLEKTIADLKSEEQAMRDRIAEAEQRAAKTEQAAADLEKALQAAQNAPEGLSGDRGSRALAFIAVNNLSEPFKAYEAECKRKAVELARARRAAGVNTPTGYADGYGLER